jgi:hypothetical protein
MLITQDVRGKLLSLRDVRNKLWSRNPLRRMLLEIRGSLNALSIPEKVHLDKFSYPHYAYGVYTSCLQAKMLGLSRITVLEFGVAGGNGLVALEEASKQIGDFLKVDVDFIGVDQGAAGLPNSCDYRDIVYWFKAGAYAMDEAKLRKRLARTQLVLGNISETLPELIKKIKAPVGFCSLDMDYYSSTRAALKLFENSNQLWLPRVMIYADDIFGFDDLNIMCEHIGEELAFSDFNNLNLGRKISVIRGLRYKRPRPSTWNEKMYAMHDFNHPRYNDCVNPESDTSAARLLSLK